MTTTARPLDLTQIPHKLKTLPQWVCWKGIPKQNGKITKPLLKPWGTAPMLASHSTPDDWGTFDQACTSLSLWGPQYPEVHGIGFVFSKNDPYGGIDLDDCYDPQTGRLLAWAQYIVGQFNTYTEISPSEHGVKLWGRGTLPGPGKNKQPIEIYDRDRYFTVTGQHLPGTPTTIEDRQELFTAYYAVWDLLSAALKASEQFAISLFPGQWQKKYPSQSEADLAFCTVLANLSASDEQIDALLQLSGLYRDQWNRQSYRAVTLRKARTERISRKKTPQEKREGHAREATADATHRTNGQQANDRSPLPPIAITPDIKTVVDASQTALLALTPRPQVFQRARRLCRMTTGVTPPKWLNRPPDLPIITELNAARLNELLTMATTFQKYDRRSKEWYDVLPPAWIAETLLSRGAWPFPLLEGIVYTPTLRPDGSFLNTPGYDADTGLYLYMNGTTFPPMPEHPTRDDARSAIKALREVFQDFPLHNAHDFSAVLAYVLTMVARYAIPGSVPLGGISANTPGTGKGLLVDAMTMIGTGRYATKWPQTIDEEEDRKRLLTVGLSGDPVVCIDNVTQALGSAALDLVLTSRSLKDRVLGKSESLEVPINAVFFATGNNLTYRGDLARRVIPIELYSNLERPEERADFHQTPLLPWVKRERPRLVVAALTILRAFFLAGSPTQDVAPLGSFEEWSATVRAALIWAGEADPAAGRASLTIEDNPELAAFAYMLECWNICYESQGVLLPDVIKEIREQAQSVGPTNQWNDLHRALTDLDTRSDGTTLNAKRLGWIFRRYKGRLLNGKRIVVATNSNNGILWKLDRSHTADLSGTGDVPF